MATFTIPPTAVPANTLTVSPGQTITAASHTATVTLTDPNGTWPLAIDNTRHIVCWGIQILRGAVWKWFVWQGDPGSTGALVDGETTVRPVDTSAQEPFGLRDRYGNLNLSLALNSSNVVSNTGDSVRLAIQTDAPYTFGATITVS